MRLIEKISQLKPQYKMAIVFVALFATAGMITILLANAATFVASSEAEGGTIGGCARSITDTDASGSEVVRFGTANCGGSGQAPIPGAAPYVRLFSQLNGAAPSNPTTAATEAAKYYAHIHGEGSTPSSFAMKNSGFGSALIQQGVWASQYRNGSYVSQANGAFDPLFTEANDLEHNAPLAIGYFWPGNYTSGTSTGGSTLNAALDTTDTTIAVSAPVSKPYGVPLTWPFINSKDVNNNGYSQSTADYIYWIRVDKEIMQITANPTASGNTINLTIKRGIWGTSATNHAANSKVFVPSYIGVSEFNGTPSRNDPNTALRYTLKFWNPEGYRWQADRILKTLGDGKSVAEGGKLVQYDTVWLDVSSCNQYNIGDYNANSIQVWDDLNNTRMTTVNWGKYQAWKLRGQSNAGGGLRDLVKHANSNIPVKFIGNSLLKPSGDTCNETLLSQVYDGGSLEGWLKGDFTDQMGLSFDIQRNNWPGLYWVRYENGYGGEVPNAKPTAHKRFTYGSYLLSYNRAATKPQFGMSWGYTKPDDLFLYNFGSALQPTNTLADTAVAAKSGLYMREYSNGIIVVNAGDNTATYNLPRNMYRVSGDDESAVDMTPQPVSDAITVNPKDAVFLMNPL